VAGKLGVSVAVRNEAGRKGLGAAKVEMLAEITLRLARVPAAAYGFSLLFVNDRAMAGFNKKFLGRSGSTDVISWPMAPQEGQDEMPAIRGLGDIAISVPRAAAQAGEYGHGLRQELALLVVHGTLHLLGYDHQQDQGQMEELQTKVMGAVNGL
jgi:probable rRNA maturation factor